MQRILHLLALAWVLLVAGLAAAPAAHAQAAWPGDEARVRTLGYRLATASAALCRAPGGMTGLMLHDIAAFAQADRDAARRDYALDSGFGVIGIVAGGAAEAAGLRPGDEIVAVGAQPMAAFAQRLIGREASYRRIEAFEDMLEAALAAGPARLRVRRGAAEATIDLAGQPGCGGRFTVLAEREANAWSDGRYVAVTSAMVRQAQDDDALAFVLAHEMAHNLLGHNGGHGARLALLDSRAPRNRELAADRLALAIVQNAGLDPAAGRDLLVGFMARREGHGGIARRVTAIDAALAGG